MQGRGNCNMPIKRGWKQQLPVFTRPRFSAERQSQASGTYVDDWSFLFLCVCHCGQSVWGLGMWRDVTMVWMSFKVWHVVPKFMPLRWLRICVCVLGGVAVDTHRQSVSAVPWYAMCDTGMDGYKWYVNPYGGRAKWDKTLSSIWHRSLHSGRDNS